MSAPLTPQEHAQRLIRARNWHLFQSGCARQQRDEATIAWSREIGAHEGMADRLEAEIRALGFDPQPPMGPRAA